MGRPEFFFRIDRLGLLRNQHETSLSPGQTSFHGVSIVVTIFAPELTLARIVVVTRDQATGTDTVYRVCQTAIGI